MGQLSAGRETTKVLRHYPEIVELTETRKRAIAGGRASLETAFKRMIADAKKPNDNVIDYDSSQAAGVAMPESVAVRATRRQQNMINQARLAAYVAQDQSSRQTVRGLTQ